MHAQRPAVAVVGHVEWVQFARVAAVPQAGAVVHASEPFEEPAGGGAVAAVQLARLAGAATLFTALGDDEHGARSVTRLLELGVDVRASKTDAPTRRAITLLDDTGERTITTLGERLEPRGADTAVEWQQLSGLDGVYLTAGDREAVLRARAGARVLVASPRAGDALAGVPLDALVYSAHDRVELDAIERVRPDAALVVATEGQHGGSYVARRATGAIPERFSAAPPPGPILDTYGSGDSFAAGLTFALAVGLELRDALALAARCGAACVAGRGPYGRQLGREEL